MKRILEDLEKDQIERWGPEERPIQLGDHLLVGILCGILAVVPAAILYLFLKGII